MNYLDILLMVPLIWGGYRGFNKGFIAELVASLLLCFLLLKGIIVFHTLLPIVRSRLPFLTHGAPMGLAILLFILGVGFIHLVTKLVRSLVCLTLLGIFDNLLGALVGLCKSAFLVSLLIYFSHYIPLPCFSPAYMAKSRLLPIIAPIVPKILKI